MSSTKALLRLFNGVRVASGVSATLHSPIKRAIKKGYILDPRIAPTPDLLNTIESVVGISGEKANSAFHKSWSVIIDTPQEALWAQAVIHYISTYGFEKLGIYSDETVYIPHEELNIPEVKDDIPLTVVKGMSDWVIIESITKLGSGIALKEETLDDIISVIKEYNLNIPIEKIKNNELKMRLYDHYNMAPTDPVDYLRYVIFKLTGQSLLIKSQKLIETIKALNAYDTHGVDYLLKLAPRNLASIFYRYKPLFLALKSVSTNKSFFNRLRKDAKKLHVPLPEDYLNNVTCRIKHSTLSYSTLLDKLEGATIYRKIRLAHALNFRLQNPNSIVYRVRNGRGWTANFLWPYGLDEETEAALNIVLQSIVENVKKNVDGKTVYIPHSVSYALPATEKQFTGHFPTGTSVSVDKDMIVGIHWFNQKHKRVDLDLSSIGVSGKTGWDSYYSSNNQSILFSGDMTSAPRPNGASELFYIKGNDYESQLMYLNYYTWKSYIPVPTKVFVAKERPSRGDVKKNYMVDPNNILAQANISVVDRQYALGVFLFENGYNRFFFANSSIGSSITAAAGIQSEQARDFFINDLRSKLTLRDVLEYTKAKVVEEKPKEGEFIDLSPQALDKNTIINLLQ